MSINFVPINQAINSAPADFLAQALNRAGSHGKKVLWLVPGGSGLVIAVAAAQRLAQLSSGKNLESIAVTLTDERYGPVGHADSNWQQLLYSGFVLPGAKLIPVLNGASRTETARTYNKILEQELATVDYRIALLGLGADGHTAGILPHSPAVLSPDLVCAYDAGNFQRLTMTPRALAWLDEAVVYAVGENKWPALAKLAEDVNIKDQPAQAWKQITKLTIFSDYQLTK